VSQLRDRKDTGGIFEPNTERLLAYFRHEHNWRTPPGPIKIWSKARATDIYLESTDGNLFGEINEIPPKLFSMRLIRTFEIYDDKKELVAVVREKPKAVGSDWVLENLEKKIIVSVIGDREQKDYEIKSSSGQVLARCFRDSSLAEGCYRVDVLGGGVDLFLLLSYVLVLDLAKWGWTTTGSFLGKYLGRKEAEKEHLLKARAAQAQVENIQSIETAYKNAKRILALTVVYAALLFIVATTALLTGSSGSSFFYGIGVVGLVIAILGVTNVKTKKFNTITILMGVYSVFSFFISYSASTISVIFAILLFIVNFIILVNVQISMGVWDSFIKKSE